MLLLPSFHKLVFVFIVPLGLGSRVHLPLVGIALFMSAAVFVKGNIYYLRPGAGSREINPQAKVLILRDQSHLLTWSRRGIMTCAATSHRGDHPC